MLVAIAEELATKLAESGERVEDFLEIKMSTDPSGTWGAIRIGVYGIVGCDYNSDENATYPEYGLTIELFRYKLVDGDWYSEEDLQNEADLNALESELPF